MAKKSLRKACKKAIKKCLGAAAKACTIAKGFKTNKARNECKSRFLSGGKKKKK
jgi:hypothetical protein